MADLTAAIDLDADHAEALYARGLIHTDKGEFAKAKKDLDRAFKIRPDLAREKPAAR